jgi:curved DNA-binding protein CbpA
LAAAYSFHTATPNSAQHHHSNNKRNHYERLGLTENATKKEIKTQFYKLSKLHHPDKNGSEASRHEFLAINEAYSILGDDRKRRDYDLNFRDKTGSLYSNSSSSSSGSQPLRGSLRRTPFRHSAQSAAAAAAARQHGAFRQTFGMGGVSGGSGGGGGGGGGPVPHFDSKSHQEMHYEQELRREERKQARERASEDAKWRKSYVDSDSAAGIIFRVTFVFLSVLIATSFMKAFADEGEDEQERYLDQKSSIYDDLSSSRKTHDHPSTILSRLEHVRSHHNDSSNTSRIALDPSSNCSLG